MSVPYEAVRGPRFVVETVDGSEQIRIPAQGAIFIGLFLAVWLCGWTVGGFYALQTLIFKGFQPFLVFWLCGWALGEGFAALTLAWMVGGAEIVRIVGGDLEVKVELFGFVRRKLYRGAEIRNLSAGAVPVFGRRNQVSLPIVAENRIGAVKFSYGARTIYIAPGLDETEGQLIVDRLLPHLPSARVSP